MQQKIQRSKIGKLIPSDRSLDLSFEVTCNCVTRDVLLENRIPFSLKRDHTDVGSIAFVTRSRVGNVDELNSHQTISTRVVTTFLSMSAGQ